MFEEAELLLLLSSSLFYPLVVQQGQQTCSKVRGLFVDTSARLTDCESSAELMADNTAQRGKATLTITAQQFLYSYSIKWKYV